jgi:nucleoside-diphosphate-sugar epimerase
MACKVFEREFDLDVRIIRIFNTYGPGNHHADGRVVPNFIMQAIANKPITVYGDGSQTRSFCYVDDLVEGLYQLMFRQGLKGEVVNVGNPDEMTILEFAKIIKEAANSSSEIIFKDLPKDDPKVRRPDISKARRLLNWEPKIPLGEGLKPTIEYFKQFID